MPPCGRRADALRSSARTKSVTPNEAGLERRRIPDALRSSARTKPATSNEASLERSQPAAAAPQHSFPQQLTPLMRSIRSDTVWEGVPPCGRRADALRSSARTKSVTPNEASLERRRITDALRSSARTKPATSNEASLERSDMRRLRRRSPRCACGAAQLPTTADSAQAFEQRPNRVQPLPEGTSLNGTFLSGRMSGGMPSTRSAMMLRRISSLPPSIRFAGERMNWRRN